MPLPDLKRFLGRVEKTSSCWIWLGYVNPTTGYGQVGFSVSGKRVTQSAHRVSWRLHRGPIPRSRPCVLHRCDNRRCVRPSHLFTGTRLDNTRDMIEKGRFRHFSGPTPSLQGERNGGAKLTEEKVRDIRLLASNHDYQTLSKRFGVHKYQIGLIVRRQRWKHI